jgi:hypothetical protein
VAASFSSNHSLYSFSYSAYLSLVLSNPSVTLANHSSGLSNPYAALFVFLPLGAVVLKVVVEVA